MEIEVGGKKYILENGPKLDRAKNKAGEDAAPEELLGIFDKEGGLIRDEEGNKIQNGPFWETHLKRKKEQPEYIRILEERESVLDVGEKQALELLSKHLDHKRAFLGTLLTISAGIIAGLFILFTNDKLIGSFSNYLAAAGGLGLILFIISSNVYLIIIFAQESLSIDKHLIFIRTSKKEFIEKVGRQIIDIGSYEKYREEKYEEEKKLNKKTEIKGSEEIWFILISGLFVISIIFILIMFLNLICA